jgi:hypothetical protein
MDILTSVEIDFMLVGHTGNQVRKLHMIAPNIVTANQLCVCILYSLSILILLSIFYLMHCIHHIQFLYSIH